MKRKLSKAWAGRRTSERNDAGVVMNGLAEDEAQSNALEVDNSFMRTYSYLRRKPTVVRYRHAARKTSVTTDPESSTGQGQLEQNGTGSLVAKNKNEKRAELERPLYIYIDGPFGVG